MCESIAITFFWYEDSSSALRYMTRPKVRTGRTIGVSAVADTRKNKTANLQADENRMRLANNSHHNRTLFHSLLRVFHLEYPALR
jgi:hypothetical protein